MEHGTPGKWKQFCFRAMDHDFKIYQKILLPFIIVIVWDLFIYSFIYRSSNILFNKCKKARKE